MIYDFVVTHGLPNGLQQDTWVTVSISFCIHYDISIMYDSVVTHGLPNGLPMYLWYMYFCDICICDNKVGYNPRIKSGLQLVTRL